MTDFPSSRQLSPVAIGGIGGSGTRLIAGILLQLGFYIGDDLNEASDNLWFTLLFKRPEATDCSDADFAALYTVFRKAMCGCDGYSEGETCLIRAAASASRLQHDSEWLSQRAESLLRARGAALRENTGWGWKEPNTHVVLPRLNALVPEMRYIHVARNGLDMSYSQNQNQLRFWGARFLGLDDPVEVTPRLSLKYWVAAHRRVREIGAGMRDRFLMVNYDRFCADPSVELPTLVAFLGLQSSQASLGAAAALIHPPGSVGRFKAFPRSRFDPEDMAFVESMGFDTEWPATGGWVEGA